MPFCHSFLPFLSLSFLTVLCFSDSFCSAFLLFACIASSSLSSLHRFFSFVLLLPYFVFSCTLFSLPFPALFLPVLPVFLIVFPAFSLRFLPLRHPSLSLLLLSPVLLFFSLLIMFLFFFSLSLRPSDYTDAQTHSFSPSPPSLVSSSHPFFILFSVGNLSSLLLDSHFCCALFPGGILFSSSSSSSFFAFALSLSFCLFVLAFLSS